MSKSYKLSGTGNYIDSTGVIHNKKELSYYLNNLGTMPIGAIVPYSASGSVPAGFLVCDGSAISRTDYADLFKAIGTTYGAGNGSTTFNIPDLRGRVPVGVNSSDTELSAIGTKGGEKTHTLTIDEMPSHDHRQTFGSKAMVDSGASGATMSR